MTLFHIYSVGCANIRLIAFNWFDIEIETLGLSTNYTTRLVLVLVPLGTVPKGASLMFD